MASVKRPPTTLLVAAGLLAAALFPSALSLPALQAAPVERLTLGEVQTVIAQAASRATEFVGEPIARQAVIAVADREGYLLGVWSLDPNPDPASAKFQSLVRNAIGKAGTASFLSSSEHAFSTRTASFIVQQHFPPGVENKPPGPLVGVNFSNLAFTDVNRFKNVTGFDPGQTNGINGAVVPLPATGGLAGASGGVPLYKQGRLVGGLGVAGDEEVGTPLPDEFVLFLGARVAVADLITDSFLYELAIAPGLVRAADVDEAVALAGQVGFAPDPGLWGNHVLVDGVSLAYIESPIRPAAAVQPLAQLGGTVTGYPLRAAPVVQYAPLTLGGVNGELRQPLQDDPALHDADPANDRIRGEARLTVDEVRQILDKAAARARTTRAGIRLPRGRPMQVFISVVANPDQPGGYPAVLGCFSTDPDTTRFSWDVCVQKARTALFFSDDSRAFSCRTVGFLAQSLYPPGIANTSPGIFHGLQEKFSQFPQGIQNPVSLALLNVPTAANTNVPNGITIFPGGFPLYRNGVLIGAIGVSGDGIDQDDIVASSGAALFPAPKEIRADRFAYRGARLPYAKFPRNPAL